MSNLTHDCPGCGVHGVPHHRLSCPRCWYQLPAELRDHINTTYRMRGADVTWRRAHWQALTDARAWYRRHCGTWTQLPDEGGPT